MTGAHNPYLLLTATFNAGGRVRAVLSSGQAVVWHRLAVMSKDGDWIVREDAADLAHILEMLAQRGARYRFGAPLDVRWLQAGWSSYLEFPDGRLRIRTDFVSRPPRIDGQRLARIWQRAGECQPAVIDIPDLIEIKKTNREKDYVIIGELARRLVDPADQMRESRSPRDLLALAERHPELVQPLVVHCPALAALFEGEESLATALDAERRAQIRANERRLQRYISAAEPLAATWPALGARLARLPLLQAHRQFIDAALSLLPTTVPRGWP